MVLSQKSLQDVLPEDHEYRTYVKKVLRHLFRQAGYRRITTPIVEAKELFEKAYGEHSDFLKKSIVTFPDQAGNKLCIRAESTVPIIRSYLSNNMKAMPQPVELYFIEPMVRFLPEAGGMEERTTFGAQLLGATDPALDAQMIFLMNKIMEELGILEHFTIQINHIGERESRKTFYEDVKNFYFDKKRSLCAECVELLKTNLIQLYRCHQEDCSILAQLAPKLEHYMSKESREEFERLKEYLTELGVRFAVNQSIVGSFTFNSRVLFEVWDNNQGKDNILARGGCSEGLAELLGSPTDVPMIGFEAGMENLIQSMKHQKIKVPKKDHLQVFVAQLGLGAKKKALKLLEDLRTSGIQAMGAIGTGSMKVQLELASNFGVKYTLLMGEMEVKSGMIIVRDMSVGTQESVPLEKAVELMQQRIGKEKMDIMENDEKGATSKKRAR